MATHFQYRQIWRTRSENSDILPYKSNDPENRKKTSLLKEGSLCLLVRTTFYAQSVQLSD